MLPEVAATTEAGPEVAHPRGPVPVVPKRAPAWLRLSAKVAPVLLAVVVLVVLLVLGPRRAHEQEAGPSYATTVQAEVLAVPSPAAGHAAGIRLAPGASAVVAIETLTSALTLEPPAVPTSIALLTPTPAQALTPAGRVALSEQPTTTVTVSATPQPTMTPMVSLPVAKTFPCAIVFAAALAPGPSPIGHIFVMDRDGRQRTLLPGYEEEVEDSRPKWLPGRKGIIYERVFRTETARRFSLWRMEPDGSLRRPLLGDTDARAATLSPNGQNFAFVSDRTGSYQIFLADLDGTEVVQLTQEKRDHRRPSWSPDGQWIAFDGGGGASSAIYVIGVDGSGLKQLTQDTQDTHPAWSPDGKFIAFVSMREGNAEVFVMNADGSGQTNVSYEPFAEDRDVSWTPEGRLLFASDRDGDFEIYVMNRNGSHVVQLTQNEVDDRWADWR